MGVPVPAVPARVFGIPVSDTAHVSTSASNPIWSGGGRFRALLFPYNVEAAGTGRWVCFTGAPLVIFREALRQIQVLRDATGQ